jgi:2-oxoglutarate dehydrogenase E1 component
LNLGEHSIARIERYLQLAAEDNLQICQPSTVAQYFHLLRRQALRPWRKPLVVFTPKSMLQHPDAASPLADFSRPCFECIVPEREIFSVGRILICTGKIEHGLRHERKRRGDSETAIVFLDQIYPFPKDDLTAEIARHPNAREIVWVQEERTNMGALGYILPRLRHYIPDLPVRSVKRSASASPATCRSLPCGLLCAMKVSWECASEVLDIQLGFSVMVRPAVDGARQ